MKIQEEYIKIICSKEYADAIKRMIVKRVFKFSDAIELLKYSNDVGMDSVLMSALGEFGYTVHYIAGYMSRHRLDIDYKEWLIARENGKIVADAMNKWGATPEEAIRNQEVLRLKGWKRFFPRIFGA